MPLQAIAIHRFDMPLLQKTKKRQSGMQTSTPVIHPAELKTHITTLYQSTTHFTDNQEMTTIFERAFARGGLMYVGVLRDIPICVLGCFDDGIANSKRLQYLAVNPQHHNQGIEAKFVKLIYDAEIKKGVRRFVPVDIQLHQIMQYYELLSVKY